MSTAKRIGGDWVESVDPNSGKKYYANLKTKMTSWTFPADLSGGSGKKDSANWVERQDPKTGKVYYFNPSTRETSWSKPNGESVAGALGSNDKKKWQKVDDPKTGKSYYYNPVTRETSWVNPDGGGEADITEEDVPETDKRVSSSRRSMRMSFRKKSTQQVSDDGDSDDSEGGRAMSRRISTQKPLAPVARVRASVRLGAATPYQRTATIGSSTMDQLSENDDQSIKSSRRRSSARRKSASRKSRRRPSGNGEGKDDRFAKLRAMREAREAGETAPKKVVEQRSRLKSEDPAAALGLGSAMGAQISLEADGVAYHDIRVYAKKHFNLKRKGFMGKPTTVDKTLNWKKDAIKTSLHRLQDSTLSAEAVSMFKLVMCYMGDRDSSRKSVEHCQRILMATVHAPEELRDELFCQIVKQTRNNPSVKNSVKGWQLMAICAGTFPPSEKLSPFLQSYCNESAEGSSVEEGLRVVEEVGPYAKYVLVRLQKSLELGPRREVPTEVEINAAKERQPVVQRVYLLDRKYRTVPVESWTTIAELNAMIAKKLEINDPTPFSTFEVSSHEEERMLDEDERVLDVLAAWKRDHDGAKRRANAVTYTFVYKMRLFFDIPDDDLSGVELAYMQAVHDVTDSRYPCSEQDCITLAGMQAQEKFGDFVPHGNVLEGNLHEYLPEKYLRGNRDDELVAAITKVYQRLDGYSSSRAKQGYLDFVMSWQIYGSAYYFVEPQNSREFPQDVVLAVNAKGLLVVDPSSKDFLAQYPYSEVVTWGHSAQTFVVVVGNLIRQNKIYFKTDQGAEINTLVHAYVNKLLEA